MISPQRNYRIRMGYSDFRVDVGKVRLWDLKISVIGHLSIAVIDPPGVNGSSDILNHLGLCSGDTLGLIASWQPFCGSQHRLGSAPFFWVAVPSVKRKISSFVLSH